MIREKNIILTPGDVSVTSEHVFSNFNDGYGVWFPVTLLVESFAIPAVRGGTVAQLPLRAIRQIEGARNSPSCF